MCYNKTHFMKKISSFINVFLCVFIVLISNNLSAKKAAIVIDYDTKEVLFEVNADTLNKLSCFFNKNYDPLYSF